MQQLGVNLIISLLDCPNKSLRLRAMGLIWNLTQHDVKNRQVFAEAGAIQKLRCALFETVNVVSSQPWGAFQLILGGLANFAMSFSAKLKQDEQLLLLGQYLTSECPEAVQQQAIRLLCNIISEGVVDAEWQKNNYVYRMSAPRDSSEVTV